MENIDDFYLPIIFDAPDFLCENNGNLEWIWRIKDEITEPDTAPYKIIEHPGGLYASAVSIDGDDINRAWFRYLFEDNDTDTFLHVLAKYQHENGGFGGMIIREPA